MPSLAGTTKTVLVADDTAFVRDRFKAAIEQAGHRVVTIRTAQELLAHLRSGLDGVDLLLLDLRLSDSSGTGLVGAVRKLDMDGQLPILVFSGTIGSAEEVRELAGMRIAGYINEYSAPQHIVPSISPHLFPDNFNRRTSPRMAIGIPVQYRFGNTIAAALTLNVSHGGLAIRTTSPLDAGTRVKVRFRLPGAATDTEADGRVAWSHRRVGMGIQFEVVDVQAQTQIDTFVDAHFFSNRKG
ncbi:MAG: PilZ domain-containing protein [Vicinamibacterales bacterium]